MGKRRLINHSDLIVEYNEGEDSNLFDFGEPENEAIAWSAHSLDQWSTYLRPIHPLAPAEKGRNASLL